MEFNLNNLFLEAKKKNKDLSKIGIAQKLWPDAKYGTQQTSINKLFNGDAKSLKPEWVPILCSELNCTPNELFGYEK